MHKYVFTFAHVYPYMYTHQNTHAHTRTHAHARMRVFVFICLRTPDTQRECQSRDSASYMYVSRIMRHEHVTNYES